MSDSIAYSISVAQVKEKLHSAATDTITFLGTGGARFMIISQELSSGGLWFNLNGTEFMVDPGPGAIVRATSQQLNPENLDAIIVSHRHIDHAHDVNIMAEAMTRGGFRQHGRLFAPGKRWKTSLLYSAISGSVWKVSRPWKQVRHSRLTISLLQHRSVTSMARKTMDSYLKRENTRLLISRIPVTSATYRNIIRETCCY